MIDKDDIYIIKNILEITNKNIDFDLLYRVLTATKDFEDLRDDILDSFGKNQIQAKSRVLQIIEENKFLNTDSEVIVFGSWYGSVLIPKLCNKVKRLSCIDLDERALKIAKNRLFPNINNVDYIVSDVFEKDRERYWNADLFINTSCEHMPPMNTWPYWPEKTNFIFTSNNMHIIEGHINCVDSMDEFKSQLPVNATVLAEDEIEDERGVRFILAGTINS